MNEGGPVLSGGNDELAGKTEAISHGGIGAIRRLVKKTGLAKHIDDNLHLLKFKQWFSILQRKRFTSPNFKSLRHLESRIKSFVRVERDGTPVSLECRILRQDPRSMRG